MIEAYLSRCFKPAAIGPALLMYLRRGFDVTIKRWTCPVCNATLEQEPADHRICPGCMTEFGYDDQERMKRK